MYNDISYTCSCGAGLPTRIPFSRLRPLSNDSFGVFPKAPQTLRTMHIYIYIYISSECQ